MGINTDGDGSDAGGDVDSSDNDDGDHGNDDEFMIMMEIIMVKTKAYLVTL